MTFPWEDVSWVTNVFSNDAGLNQGYHRFAYDKYVADAQNDGLMANVCKTITCKLHVQKLKNDHTPSKTKWCRFCESEFDPREYFLLHRTQ